jgi:hypothetical protein
MTTTRYLVILALALAVGPASVTAAEPDPGDPEPAHFCNDPTANQEWAELLAQNPDDRIVVRLYALRVGLCTMIDQNLIAVDRAITWFEQERERAVIERRLETGRQGRDLLL